MSLLDPDSDIAAITRRDRNAERVLPEIIRHMGAMELFRDLVTINVKLAYEYADEMERQRNSTE